MKKMIFLMLVFFLGISAGTNAQVKIGGDGTTGSADGAVLELDGAKGGLLLPKATLDNNTFIPVAWGTAILPTGVIVYNLGSAGLDARVYVWNGSEWMTGTSGGTGGGDDELVIGDNHYTIGDFGTAGIWMTENLRQTTGLTENTDGTSTTTKDYTHVNKSSTNDANYGLLYNWYECRTKDAFHEQCQWVTQTSEPKSNAKNAGGMDVLLVGYVGNGSANNYGQGAGFWSSSTGTSSTSAWNRYVRYDNNGMGRGGANSKAYYFGVRCKKD
jgi:hypothetical protein